MSGKFGESLNAAFIWARLEVTNFLCNRSEVVFQGVSLDYHFLTITLGTYPCVI